MAQTAQGGTWSSETGSPGQPPPSGASAEDGPTADTTGSLAARTASAHVAPQPDLRAATVSNGLHRQVFGFLPYWELSDSSTTLNYGLLSTIAYFSVGVDQSGNLLRRNPDGSVAVGWSGWTSSKLTSVINAAHSTGTRVVLTLTMFAWTTGQASAQSAFLGNPTARSNLARQAGAAVRDRGADGINLDFEPIATGRADEFTALVRSIRSELDRIAPGYQLTFDTTGRIANYPLEDATAAGGADAVFVMGYDYRTADSPYVGSVAPLAGPAYDITDTVLSYLGHVPASKLILGVPYYGRAWSTVSSALDAKNQSGAKYGHSTTVTYDTAATLAAQNGRRYDALEETAWFAYQRQNCTAAYGCVTSWRQVYYEDAQSLRAKYDLINRYGLRGAGIWALGYDGTRYELYKAIIDKFLHDTTPPDAGIVALPPTESDEGFLVDWTGRDDFNGVRSFDVQVSVDGGAWTNWLTNSTAGAETFLGHDGHGYAFRVRARDGKGNVSGWEIGNVYVANPTLQAGGFGRTAVDNLSLRSAPDPNATRLGGLTAGTIVALTLGPVSAGGYTWYEVTSPITEWPAVRQTDQGSWIATDGGGSTFVTPIRPPNSTLVTAGIVGLTFGNGGAASLGSAPAALAHRAFSPNADGTQDSLTLRWRNAVALSSLTLNVFAADGTKVDSRSLSQTGPGDEAYDWDGIAGGKALPDGTYLLQLTGTAGSTTYAAPSAHPVSAAQLAMFGVTVDTVPPPLGRVSFSGSPFSPNGDGRRDVVSVAASAPGAVRWLFTATPVSADGADSGGAASPPALPIRTISGSGSSAKVSWNGRTNDGSAAPDGVYRLTLRLLDTAGNGPAPSWNATLDTRRPATTLAPSVATFTPNGDGADDRTSIAWTADESVTGWLRVVHGTTLIRRWPVARAGTGHVAWDGRDSSGRPVPDGHYAVEIDVSDAAGNMTVTRTALTVDRTLRLLRWNPSRFDPVDGDGLAATARLTFSLTRSATTTLQIYDAAGRLVRNGFVNRKLATGGIAWTWDGRDAHGHLVLSGTYLAVVTATSSMGTTVLRRAVFAGPYLVSGLPTEIKAGSTIILTIASVEPLRAAPTVTLTQTGQSAVKKTAESIGGLRYRVLFDIAAAPGPVSVVISARDSAGGLNTATFQATAR